MALPLRRAMPCSEARRRVAAPRPPADGAGRLRGRAVEGVRRRVARSERIAYGSGLRGDARTDSDYDFLFVVDGEVGWRREDQIRQCLSPLELATGAVLTVHAVTVQLVKT